MHYYYYYYYYFNFLSLGAFEAGSPILTLAVSSSNR